MIGGALLAVLLLRTLARSLRALGHPLEDQVCLVAGPPEGEALVIARHLLWRGARVGLCAVAEGDTDPGTLERVAAGLGSGRDARVLSCRPQDRNSVEAMLREVSESLGEIRILVTVAPAGLIPELVGGEVLVVSAGGRGRSRGELRAQKLVDTIEGRRGRAATGGGRRFQPHRPSL